MTGWLDALKLMIFDAAAYIRGLTLIVLQAMGWESIFNPPVLAVATSLLKRVFEPRVASVYFCLDGPCSLLCGRFGKQLLCFFFGVFHRTLLIMYSVSVELDVSPGSIGSGGNGNSDSGIPNDFFSS